MVRIRKFTEELDMSQPSVKELEDKFDFYNEKCFEGKLVRDFPITYKSSNKVFGACFIKKIPLGQRNELGDIFGVLKIELTPVRPRDAIFATLLHEMIHAYTIQVLQKTFSSDKSWHGVLFQKIFKRISAQGFRVSASDSIDTYDTEKLNSNVKPFLVLETTRFKYCIPLDENPSKNTDSFFKALFEWLWTREISWLKDYVRVRPIPVSFYFVLTNTYFSLNFTQIGGHYKLRSQLDVDRMLEGAVSVKNVKFEVVRKMANWDYGFYAGVVRDDWNNFVAFKAIPLLKKGLAIAD